MIWLQNTGVALVQRFKIFVALCKNAKLSLFTDADLERDPMCSTLINSMFLPHEIEMHRYPTQRLTYQFDVVPDITEDLEACLSAGNKVGVVCRTKSNALKIAEKFKHYKTKVISRDMDDNDTRKLDKVDDMLSDIQLVILTTKASVGVSIEDQYDNVFF